MHANTSLGVTEMTHTPDFEAAPEFLALLGSHADKFCCRMFDGIKIRADPSLMAKFNGNLEKQLGALSAKSSGGTGVCVLVNDRAIH